MFDSHRDLAALVYDRDQKPDEVLHAFAAELRAQGHRVVGVVQLAGHCLDGQLAVTVLHTGEKIPLLENRGANADGCRLDVGRLMDAAAKVETAIDQGADILILNRFGKQEQEGKGLSYLIARALSANIAVVIAVASTAFPHWTKFSEGMSVKLNCDDAALRAWWRVVSGQGASSGRAQVHSVCGTIK